MTPLKTTAWEAKRIRTRSKLDATWRRFGRNCSKYRTGIATKSLLVYTGERDKNCTKNRMCKPAFKEVPFKLYLF